MKYMRTILNSTDILCLQEHWLFTFEQKLVDEELPGFQSQLKCVDDDDPISHMERIRGYGGTLTLWNASLDKHVKRIQDGTHRVNVIELLTKPVPSIIINAYLPCRNARSADDFQEVLDIIAEIIHKYGPTHGILLAGDLNSSLHRTPPNKNDKLLRNFVRETGLCLPTSCTGKNTFFHHNGRDTAVIDYILTYSANSNTDYLSHINVITDDLDPDNTSDHTLVQASWTSSFSASSNGRNLLKEDKSRLGRKCRWDKCDTHLYQDLVGQYVDATDLSDSPSITRLGMQCKSIENVLHYAAEQCIPNYRLNSTRRTKGRGTWSPDIQLASKSSKKAYWAWKVCGSPKEKSHPTNLKRREAKRLLRRLQRQTHIRKSVALQKEIMDASDFDQKLFFRLVNKQRHRNTAYTELLEVDGEQLSTTDDIINGWKVHFERLATPATDTNFNQEHYDIVKLQESVIKVICMETPFPYPQVTEQDVRSAIRSLSNNKAADAYGLMAEHFKLAISHLVSPLTRLLNNIIKQAKLPEALKLGILSPVLKKGKDKTIPGNYRGITVTPIISKLLEATLQRHLDDILLPTQNRLQRGFTAKTSPLNAALLVSECLNEAKDSGTACALATLDAEKAFDTVWHDGLAVKLYHAGVRGKLWSLVCDMQTSGQNAVKWANCVSDPFLTQQGIRQGAKLSTSLYKRYNNGILDQIQDRHLGSKVGCLHIGAPTVADDISLVADNPSDLQHMLNIVGDATSKDRFRINSSKSNVVIYNPPRSREPQSWHIGKTEIEETSSTTHIGLKRASNLDSDICSRVEKGRRTMYALLGAGLHGRNGLNPLVSARLWTVFGLPRVIYGLEVVSLKASELKTMATYERKLLRQIQYLPDRCATIPIYILSGVMPIEASIDRRLLSMFVGLLKQPESLEYQLIRRQLAVKEGDSYSWVVRVRRLLQKYSLPSAFELWENPPSKENWKRALMDAFNAFFHEKWTAEAKQKSSLRYLHISERPFDGKHPVWASACTDAREIKKACVKVRLMTGSYTLQANRHRFNQNEVSPLCCLCKKDPEDRAHFLLKCSTLASAREKHLNRLRVVLTDHVSPDAVNDIMNSDDQLLQCIIDATDTQIFRLIDMQLHVVYKIETVSRNLINDIDNLRTKILNSIIAR